MSVTQTVPVRRAQDPVWYVVPARILLVTFLLTLLSFALGLLIGIVGTATWSGLHHVQPDMRVAYRYIAFPLAKGVAVIAFLAMTFSEIRRYRQSRALARIADLSR